MTKTEAFTRDEAKRTILLNALPVVLEALEAAKDELEAARVNAGVPNDTVGNSYFQQIVGARHLIQRLPELTRVPTEPKTPLGRRQYTEADRDTLKNQHNG